MNHACTYMMQQGLWVFLFYMRKMQCNSNPTHIGVIVLSYVIKSV